MPDKHMPQEIPVLSCGCVSVSLQLKVKSHADCVCTPDCALLQSEELQAKLDANAPELFEGEPDLPPVPNAIDDLLEIALPGTAGYNPDLSAQTDFIRDILPEGDDDPPASGAAKEE